MLFRSLKIRQTTDKPDQFLFTGLFAQIGRNGKVMNTNLENCDITLDSSGKYSAGTNATGGLAGMSYGVVANCSVSGTIEGIFGVGGLIGESGWGSRVEGCSVKVSVIGNASVGALVGSLHNALVTDCEAEGEVIAAKKTGGSVTPRGIGGFSGFMVMGTVRDCRSSVFVKTMISADWVGGFMGYNQGEIINCLYDKNKTANWEAVDVVYQDSLSDVRDIAENDPDVPDSPSQSESS